MKRLFTIMTMFAITAAMVGCTQDDGQAQKPDTGSVDISGDDDTTEPVDHSVAKPVVPDDGSTEEPATAEEPVTPEEPETKADSKPEEPEADK